MHDISKVLLITDLDGTLLPESKIISETDLNAINDFRAKGGLFTVATGRTIQSMQNYFDILKLEIPAILYNGAMIYDTNSKKVLYSQNLDISAKETVRLILDKFPFVACEILKADGVYIVRNNEYEQNHTEVCKVSPVYCNLDDMECEGWLKVLFAMNPEKSDEVWNFVSILENSKDFIRSSSTFIELLPCNISKGSALKKYKEITGLDNSYKIVATGDYNNDVEMIKYADIGIAPSNACDEVKQFSDFISEKSCEENALADAVKYIFTEVILMDATIKKNLEATACKVRMGIIEGTYNAKSGHPGGSLSIADLLTYLYFAKMNVSPENPDMEDRDRFVLSKGHCAPALYSTLAQRGFFSADELKSLRHIGAMLQGHPCISIPGIDMSSGSLGQGISTACGMALSGKISNKDYKVYTVLGDGEIEEGQVWEAAMFAAHYNLDNLIAVVDNNGLQIDGSIEDVCSPYPITDKFEAFGWHVITMDAHDFDDIERAFNEAETISGKPVAIIQKSIKGKGVSFMENQCSWHGTAPNKEQYEQAMQELNTALNELEGK